MKNIIEVMKQIEQAHWNTREHYVDQKRMEGYNEYLKSGLIIK